MSDRGPVPGRTPLLLGCIADDLTGAADLAGTLVREGMRVAVVVGAPTAADRDAPPAEAVVVALKSRSCPADEAVAQSLASAEWLLARGAERLFFKYCSTFDSTDEGNIGPVADALLDRLEESFTVVAPAFPRNGRTVYAGHLFVGDVLLSESGMRHHPATPMTDANLIRVLGRQTDGPVGGVFHRTVSQGPEAVADQLRAMRLEGYRYAVVDAIDDVDLTTLAEAVGDWRLVTGGSAVAGAIAAFVRLRGAFVPVEAPTPSAASSALRVAVLAGSCSAATLAQVEQFKKLYPAHEIDVSRLAAGEDVAAEAVEWALAHLAHKPVLVYSSAAPDVLERQHAAIGRHAGELVEKVMARVAEQLLRRGARHFVVAGGETSGAVIQGLGVRWLSVGDELVPGVPCTISTGQPKVALVLKSGNFGAPTFFEDAIAWMEGRA